MILTLKLVLLGSAIEQTQASKAVANSTQSKQNKQKVSHTIILPLKSVLLGLAIEQTQTSKAVANST